jgi:hydrogenase maturation protein HypF
MAVAHAVVAGATIEDVEARIPPVAFRGVRQIAEKGSAPPTSSVGRLFDAVAALIGVRDYTAFEGQAAMELEALATARSAAQYHFELDTSSTPWTIHAAPLVRSVIRDVRRGVPASAIAGAFHAGLAAMIADVTTRIAHATGIRRVALTGGVFQNGRLTEAAGSALSSAGLEVLLHRRVPCNDGGLALGQAVAAARMLRAGALEAPRICV